MKFYIKLISCLVCVMLILCLFSSIGVTADNNESKSVSTDFAGMQHITSGENIDMFADLSTGHFKLVDKKFGTIWSTELMNAEEDTVTKRKDKLAYGSQIIIDYVIRDGFTASGLTSTLNSNISCINKENVSVSRLESGIKVLYKFEDCEIEIPVSYTLENDKLIATIDTDNIKESKEYALYRVHLLPAFGAGTNSENGYLFVPDGCGAVIDFNNNSIKNEYLAQVYGEELSVKKDAVYNKKETIRMPVFGISKANVGVLGVITEGDTSSLIKAVVANSTMGYNLNYSIMQYREIGEDDMISNKSTTSAIYRVSEQKYSLDKYTVEYSFVFEEDNNYTGMADVYRNYLIQEKQLKQHENSTLLNLNIYGAIETQGNFLGIKYKKLKSLTSYEQVVDLTELFADKGMDNLSIRYIGWQNDGIFNLKQIKKSKVLRVLGGKTDFKQMQNSLQEEVDIWFEADLMQTRKGSSKQVASTMFNKKAYQYDYLPSVYVSNINIEPWFFLNKNTLTKNSNKYLKSLNKEIKNISLSTITNLIYSDFREGTGSYRTDIALAVEKILKSAKDMGYNIMGESVNAYALPYVSSVINSPTKTSGYMMFDKEIPFYQIVLHSLLPLTTGVQQTELKYNTEFLKAAETGSGILFNCIYDDDSSIFRGSREENLYSSSYELWIDRVQKQFLQYEEIFEAVKNSQIVEHKQLFENVMLTKFSNNKEIIVNYSNEDVEIDGKIVYGRQFIIR